MTLSHGYFLGPGESGKSRVGPEPRPTDQLLMGTVLAGKTPVITDADRAKARSDFAYWNTAIVVLEPGPLTPEVTRETLDALAGPGQLIGGVWVWDVRGLR